MMGFFHDVTNAIWNYTPSPWRKHWDVLTTFIHLPFDYRLTSSSLLSLYLYDGAEFVSHTRQYTEISETNNDLQILMFELVTLTFQIGFLDSQFSIFLSAP